MGGWLDIECPRINFSSFDATHIEKFQEKWIPGDLSPSAIGQFLDTA
jgi:hypothetical protein